MKPMQARYNIFCNEAGGTHDDTIFYRLDDGWLLVVNASNAEKMWKLAQRAASSVGVSSWRTATAAGADRDSRSALGRDACSRTSTSTSPRCVITSARKAASTASGGDRAHRLYRRRRLRALRRRRGRAALWNALLREHQARRFEPCGLGARDVLRLEAGMPLYGHELTERSRPCKPA